MVLLGDDAVQEWADTIPERDFLMTANHTAVLFICLLSPGHGLVGRARGPCASRPLEVHGASDV
jgi:hypothetical protein